MKLIRYYDHGWRIALLVKEGHVYAHLIPMNAKGLKVVRVSAEQDESFQYFDDTEVPEAVKRFREFGQRVGMTQAVKEYLGIKDDA